MCENKQFSVNMSGNELSEGKDAVHCLNANDQRKVFGAKQEHTMVALPVLTPEREEKRQNGRRFKDNNEDMFTLTAQDRHGVAIEVKEATKKGYTVAHEGDSINLSMPDSKTRRGRIGGGGWRRRWTLNAIRG
jgi:DNA (cytosine-5)-methyltransferase 1